MVIGTLSAHRFTLGVAAMALTACAPLTGVRAGHGKGPVNAAEASINVTSYNIYIDYQGSGWSKRRAGFYNYLAQGNFDVAALQEATELQLADLSASLPDYDYVIGNRSDGHRGDQRWYEFVPIFYKRDRFEQLATGSFWVSQTPTKPGSIMPETKFHGRAFSWVQLRDRASGVVYLVGSVHIHGLQAVKEIAAIRQMLAKVEHDGPVILLGDYNMLPTSDGYRSIVGKDPLTSFVDAHEIAKETSGPWRTTITGNEFAHDVNGTKQTNKEAFEQHIDYIFTCGIESVPRFQTEPNQQGDGSFTSDHFALSAELIGARHCAVE
jgi:endonuclease/exonuclease/phosphatase family metal-dependent hydrolase